MKLNLSEQTLILSCLENYEYELQDERGSYVSIGNREGAMHIDRILAVVASAKAKINKMIRE